MTQPQYPQLSLLSRHVFLSKLWFYTIVLSFRLSVKKSRASNTDENRQQFTAGSCFCKKNASREAYMRARFRASAAVAHEAVALCNDAGRPACAQGPPASWPPRVAAPRPVVETFTHANKQTRTELSIHHQLTARQQKPAGAE